jgi:dsRNA-specific ribonuclease
VWTHERLQRSGVAPVVEACRLVLTRAPGLHSLSRAGGASSAQQQQRGLHAVAMERIRRIGSNTARIMRRKQEVPVTSANLWRHAPCSAIAPYVPASSAAPCPTYRSYSSTVRTHSAVSTSTLASSAQQARLELTLIQQAADGARWRDCVRALVELRHIATQQQPHSSDQAIPAQQPFALTLSHFHSVLRCILNACSSPCSNTYPEQLVASSWTNELVESFVGVKQPRDERPASLSNHPPTELLESLQPDLAFYHSLLDRIEHSLQRPSSITYSMNASSPGMVQNLNSPHGMWMLVMALEATRKQPNDATKTNLAANSASMLPPLALVRHLFNGIVEVGLRPTRQTINFILAIHDAHGRASELLGKPPGAESVDQPDDASSAQEDPADASSPDVDYIWELWSEMERSHAVHPDLLSQLLMLRICYRQRQYGYMAKLLAESQIAQNLLSIAEPILHHSFTSPHLLLSALTHSSQVSSRIDSNERMEFLGDAVLDVLVREMLVERATRQIGMSMDCESIDDASAPLTATPFLDISTPDFLRSDHLPVTMLAQLKGKFVSHRSLATCSRALGLSSLLLQANHDVRSSVLGWQEKRDRKRRTGRKHVIRQGKEEVAGVKTDVSTWDSNVTSASANDAAKEPVPDNLAEDVFESCLAALYLDSADPTASARSSLPVSSTVANGVPAYGIAVARAFLRRSLGAPLFSEIASALSSHASKQYNSSITSSIDYAEHRARNLKQGKPQSQKLDGAFDRRTNYKRLLELWVRGVYTDDSTRQCNAHILYVAHGQMGAHLHRSRVVVKVLPDAIAQGRYRHTRHHPNHNGRGKQSKQEKQNEDDATYSSLLIASANRSTGLAYLEFLASQERARRQSPSHDANSSSNQSSAPSSSSSSSSPISFSVSPIQVPLLNSDFDREFPLVLEMPELSTAEQMAAFAALKKLGVLQLAQKKKREAEKQLQHQQLQQQQQSPRDLQSIARKARGKAAAPAATL